jgi:hypothetical protein
MRNHRAILFATAKRSCCILPVSLLVLASLVPLSKINASEVDTLWIGGGFGANWRQNNLGRPEMGLEVGVSCRFRVNRWLSLGMSVDYEESRAASFDQQSNSTEMGFLYSFPMAATVFVECGRLFGAMQFVQCGLGICRYNLRCKLGKMAAGSTVNIPIGLGIRSPGGAVSISAEARCLGFIFGHDDLDIGGIVFMMKMELQFPVVIISQ